MTQKPLGPKTRKANKRAVYAFAHELDQITRI